MKRAFAALVVAIAVAVIIPVRASAPVDQYGTFSSGNPTIRDLRTSLTWERAIADTTMTQDLAAARCKMLQLSGLSWRLPTYKELLTIVDEHYYYYLDSGGVARSRAIDIYAFPDTPDSDFWSSSLAAGQPGYGWVVNFSKGESDVVATNQARYVRCVHDEQ